MTKKVSREVSQREAPRQRMDLQDAMQEYQRRLAAEESQTFFDLAKAPEGMEYTWGVSTVYGEPVPMRLPKMARNFFTPVPFSRHMDLYQAYMGRDASPDDPIDVGGLRLMERHTALGDLQREAKSREIAAQENVIANNVHVNDSLTRFRYRSDKTSGGRMMNTSRGGSQDHSGTALQNASHLDW